VKGKAPRSAETFPWTRSKGKVTEVVRHKDEVPEDEAPVGVHTVRFLRKPPRLAAGVAGRNGEGEDEEEDAQDKTHAKIDVVRRLAEREPDGSGQQQRQAQTLEKALFHRLLLYSAGAEKTGRWLLAGMKKAFAGGKGSFRNESSPGGYAEGLSWLVKLCRLLFAQGSVQMLHGDCTKVKAIWIAPILQIQGVSRC